MRPRVGPSYWRVNFCIGIRNKLIGDAAVMNLRASVIALVATCFTAPAFANCYDTPTWHGEPLTPSFLDGLEHGVRRASLSMLLLSEEPANERRIELKRRLIRTALIQFDGDRGELRKKLLEGTLYDVIKRIDFRTLKAERPKQYHSGLLVERMRRKISGFTCGSD